MNIQLLIVEMFSKVLHHSGMRQTTKEPDWQMER